ncbi:MAG: hypothetical protein IPO40_10045 [Fibrobacteres bacterium]|nr:hypothetical protein [Fibrobacterota bacterium]
MLLAIALSALQSAAQPPVPDLFRPDPTLQFLDSRGQLLPEEAKRVALRVEAIDTFELRARPVSPQEAAKRAKASSRWDSDRHGTGEDPALDTRPWPYRIRMSRPRDSLTRWTAWMDLDRAAKQFPGSFLEVQVIAGPRAYRPSTKDENCDSTWAKALYLVTDLGIVAHSVGPDSLEIQTLDLARVRPWGSASLERLTGRPLKTQTDSTGALRIQRPDFEDTSEFWVARTPGPSERIAFLELGRDSRDDAWQQFHNLDFLGGAGGYHSYTNGQRVFPYVFRSSHRPGDTLVVGCLARGPGGALPLTKALKFRISHRDVVIDSLSITLDASGHAQWRWKVPANLRSGWYNIQADLGESSGSTSFSVEEAKIPRLRVNLTEDTSRQKFRLGEWNVHSAWSTGRPTPNLPLEFGLSCQGHSTRGNNYSCQPLGMVESDPQKWDTAFTAILDSVGRFSTPFLVPPRHMVGDEWTCEARASVFEDGGHATTKTMGQWESKWRAGPGLRKRTHDTLLRLSVGWFDKYDSMDAKTPLRVKILWDKRELASKQMKSGETWNLPVRQVSRLLDDQTHDYSLEAVVCAKDGGSCIHEMLELEPGDEGKLVWQRRYESDEGNSKDADTLPHPDLSPRIVQEGDSVQVRWESEQPGLAWVQVIQGDRILRSDLRPVKTGTNLWKAASDSTWSPTVHIAVMDFARRNDSLPWMKVAGMRVDVKRRVDSLPISIVADSVFHPGQIAHVSVLNPTGRKGSFVISAIDQGILDLDNFQMKDPEETFSVPERGQFDWWNGCGSRKALYETDFRATCYTEPDPFKRGSRMHGISGMGFGKGGSHGGMGVGSGEGPAGPARALAKPLSWISSILPLPSSRADLEFPIPSFLGSARIRLIAASGRDIRILDTQVVSRSALEIAVSTPQTLSPSDTVIALVKVFGKPSLAGSLKTSTWEGLRQLDSSRRTLSFDAKGVALARLPLVAGTEASEGWLEVEATQGSDVLAMTSRVEIRDRRNLSSDAVRGTSTDGSVNLALPKRYLDSGSTARLEVATGSILGLDRRIRQLLAYPHGCLEQVVSAAFPQLLLPQLFPGSSKEERDVALSHANDAIVKIQRLRTPDGLLSLWPGQSTSDPFASLWAARFLQEAKARDVQGGSDLLQKLTESLAKIHLQDPTEEIQRFALAPTFRSRYDRRDEKDTTRLDSLSGLPLSREARWVLAAAWERHGHHDKALAQMAQARATPTSLSRVGRYGRASLLRDQAWALEAMVTLSAREARDSLVGVVSRDISSQRWLSTQEQGALFVALSKVLALRDTSAMDTVQWKSPKGKWTPLILADGRGAIEIPAGLDTIQVRSARKGKILQAQVDRQGALRSPETLRDSGFTVDARVLDASGAPVTKALRERDAFTLEIRVKNLSGQDLTDIAVATAIPGGWSVRRNEVQSNQAGIHHLDVRADRAVHHFNLANGQEKILRLPLRALQEGSYREAEVTVEALYDAVLRAHWKGERVRISP